MWFGMLHEIGNHNNMWLKFSFVSWMMEPLWFRKLSIWPYLITTIQTLSAPSTDYNTCTSGKELGPGPAAVKSTSGAITGEARNAIFIIDQPSNVLDKPVDYIRYFQPISLKGRDNDMLKWSHSTTRCIFCGNVPTRRSTELGQVSQVETLRFQDSLQEANNNII